MFSLVGCGEVAKKDLKPETLTCTTSSLEDDLKMDNETTMTFLNNKMIKMTMKFSFTVEKDYENLTEELKKGLEEQYKSYSDNGADVDVFTEGATVVAKIDMDFEKMSEEQKKKLEVNNFSGSLSDNKKDFESSGYTCK